MKTFFKSFLGSLLAMMVAGIILIFVFFAVLAGSLSSFKMDKTPDVKDNTVLYISLENGIIDRTSKNPFENFDLNTFESKKELGLDDILESIEKAKNDDHIKGIYLNITNLPAGFALIEEVRNALLDFKESEKWIISYSEIYSQKGYYLASVADEVLLYPEGMLDFKGLSSEVMFLKGALEKLDVEAQIIRGSNNKFKAAVEPLMYKEMSDANREQIETYLGSLWGHYLEGIAKQRGLTTENLQEIADSAKIREPKDAVTEKLVDKLVYKDELLAMLKEKLGVEEDDDIESIQLAKYIKAKDPNKSLKDKLTVDDEVAVIYAIGGIESGEGDGRTIGSERISKAIREARTDSSVKAIVLRVNSPGGSALASDVIWREMVLAKEVKPVVVSMGDVAASGGYYIACAADRIFANPNTITGSIGVFGVLPNLKGMWNNHLGINFSRVKTAQYADLGSPNRPLTPEEYSLIQEGVDDIYQDFITKVGKGRDMQPSEVDSIGQGRVWSGVDAKRIGLIDEFGGLNAAIAYAAEKAELKDWKIKSLPEQKNPVDEFIKEMSGEAQTRMAQNELGYYYKHYSYVKDLTKLQGMQMRLPYMIDVN